MNADLVPAQLVLDAENQQGIMVETMLKQLILESTQLQLWPLS